MELILGDCLEKLKELEDNSVDAIVTDPPYGISFMGKKWDYDVPQVEVWKECLRVLKPGGYLLSFAGTRTQHRMAVNIENAGFEIRDMIAWVYGSGFPKSLNIGKAVDKLQGNERKISGYEERFGREGRKAKCGFKEEYVGASGTQDQSAMRPIMLPVSEEAKQWEGWGTALKPALEPITVARKPLEEKTVAENCLKWGVGGINIDGCRVETSEDQRRPSRGGNNGLNGTQTFKIRERKVEDQVQHTGRFPANLIHDGSEEVVGLFPQTKQDKPHARNINGTVNKGYVGDFGLKGTPEVISGFGDSGSAARFFYTAKASKRERNMGLDCYLTVKYNNICKEENMVVVQLLKRVISGSEVMSLNIGESGEDIMVQCHKDSLSTILTEINRIIGFKTLPSLTHSLTSESTLDVNSEMGSGGSHVESVVSLKKYLLTITKGNQGLALGASRVASQMLLSIREKGNWQEAKNSHSTVKPVVLMRYLCRLITPRGGVILDPYMGSGTTGIGAKLEGFDFIGIEREEEYIKIAQARIEAWEVDEQLELSKLK